MEPVHEDQRTFGETLTDITFGGDESFRDNGLETVGDLLQYIMSFGFITEGFTGTDVLSELQATMIEGPAPDAAPTQNFDAQAELDAGRNPLMGGPAPTGMS